MEMFLMGACIAVFGLAVVCIAFRAAVPAEETVESEAAAREPAPALPRGSFFVDRVAGPDPAMARVPIEALLLQIESHVRLEQAAAESFIGYPTSELLHSRTVSPFVN